MKYPIDVAFLDRNKKVIGVRKAIPPYRLTPIYWRAECVLELPVATLEKSKTEVGDLLQWQEHEPLEGALTANQ